MIRDILLIGHRQAFTWVDEWCGESPRFPRPLHTGLPKPPTPLVPHIPMPLPRLTACFTARLGPCWARLGQSSTVARQSKTATIGVTNGVSTALCLPVRSLGRFVPSIHAYKWPQPKARDPTPLILLPVHPCGLPAWHTLAVPCMYMESPCTPYIAQHPLPALSVCPLLMVSCCHPPVPACPSAPALVAFPVCSSAGTLCPGLAPQGAGGHWGGCQRWL